MRRECRVRFPRHQLHRKPLISDPGMHHGTCVTHVPWCMSGSVTRKNIKRHTANTIVSWPNPKQWWRGKRCAFYKMDSYHIYMENKAVVDYLLTPMRFAPIIIIQMASNRWFDIKRIVLKHSIAGSLCGEDTRPVATLQFMASYIHEENVLVAFHFMK